MYICTAKMIVKFSKDHSVDVGFLNNYQGCFMLKAFQTSYRRDYSRYLIFCSVNVFVVLEMPPGGNLLHQLCCTWSRSLSGHCNMLLCILGESLQYTLPGGTGSESVIFCINEHIFVLFLHIDKKIKWLCKNFIAVQFSFWIEVFCFALLKSNGNGKKRIYTYRIYTKSTIKLDFYQT